MTSFPRGSVQVGCAKLRGEITKAVVPVAGIGTRLLPATKEQPKEMLPIFAADTEGELSVVPTVQAIFAQLASFGLKEFCFVVGRGKEAIVKHFTPDREFLDRLDRKGKHKESKQLGGFYRLVSHSAFSWVNQPEPLGFGHALLMAEQFVGDSNFIVHAGDTYIVSRKESFLRRLTEAHRRSEADATLVLLKVAPTKGYGFAVVQGHGDVLTVKEVVEKPPKPPSNLAIMPVYAFGPAILEALKTSSPGYGDEIQLTDGIQKLIDKGRNVQAVKLTAEDIRLDIGSPQLYWEALQLSRRHFRRIGRITP